MISKTIQIYLVHHKAKMQFQRFNYIYKINKKLDKKYRFKGEDN